MDGYYSVADPGPLMLGVLEWWTPTVNVLQTLIEIGFHIELYPIEARDSISLYTTPLSIWPSGFRDFRCVVGLTYRKHITLNFATY